MLKIKNTFIVLVPIAIGIATLFTSCKKDHWNDLFKPTGADETRIREVSGFNKIKLYDKIDVYLTQGPVFEVKVQAGKNLHIGIVTEIREDSTLIIKNENKANFIRSQTKKISVHITAPHFYYIEHKGVGTIYCNNSLVEDTVNVRLESSGDIHLNINSNCLKTSSHGNGDVYVTGNANCSYNYLNGTNIIDMEECTVKNYMFVETVSVCHSYIKAPENGILEANIWSLGNLYYQGNPATISYKNHSKGDLLKK